MRLRAGEFICLSYQVRHVARTGLKQKKPVLSGRAKGGPSEMLYAEIGFRELLFKLLNSLFSGFVQVLLADRVGV